MDDDPKPSKTMRQAAAAEERSEAGPAPVDAPLQTRRPRTKPTDVEPPTPPPQPAPGRRAARATNSLEPARERPRARRPATEDKDRPPLNAPGSPSHRPGDVPASLMRRYFTETLRGGTVKAFYEGPGAKAVAFHDHGSRLATHQTHPAVVRDLAAIAEHRGWRAIQVKGEDEFRREVWLEARVRGLQVKGYKPRERDRQELDRRLDVARGPLKPAAARTVPPFERSAKPPQAERPEGDLGVAGVLLTSGRAPYRRRAGEPSTPFIRIDRGDGRALDVWGAGLPDALARSGAKIGDAVRVRRDGIDVVERAGEVRDLKTEGPSTRRPDAGRNRRIIEAERFRQASPGQAARDPDMRGAQSHLAVMNVVIDRSVKDPQGRQRLRAQARDIVADQLAQGRSFTPARIRQIEPVLARDMSETRRSATESERAHRR